MDQLLCVQKCLRGPVILFFLLLLIALFFGGIGQRGDEPYITIKKEKETEVERGGVKKENSIKRL